MPVTTPPGPEDGTGEGHVSAEAPPERAMSAVVVENLAKRFGDFTAVQDVSFEVAAGQVTALVGPNGAGKTTTIEILEGFQAPSAGTARVLGADPRKGGRAFKARIGLDLQSTSLEDQLTVAESLALYRSLYA